MDRRLLLILVIFLLPFISAQNITVNYPSEVILDEEFSVIISLMDFEAGVYDVKIDVLADLERVGKILDNNVWRSTYYYVSGIISSGEEKEFLLKVETYLGIADMTIKIRDSSGNVEVFEGYRIEISRQQTEQDQTQPEENESQGDPEEPTQSQNNENPAEQAPLP